MITDILARLAILQKEIPQDEFDPDTAVEAAIEDVGREVTDEERAELDSLLPEWLEDDNEVAA